MFFLLKIESTLMAMPLEFIALIQLSFSKPSPSHNFLQVNYTYLIYFLSENLCTEQFRH